MNASNVERSSRSCRRRPRPAILAGLFVAALATSLPTDLAEARKAKKAALTSDDLIIVDCLLPPKMRRLGRRATYLSARQPIRTTAVDCGIRGGEYTQPDQANLGTALKVWLTPAQAGDTEAQFYVGQIFEKGLGVPPDYAAAAEWYQKAAEQGYASAQINLGSLYETGRGVEQDAQEALRWYRRAAGLAEDLVVLQSSEYEELTRAREQLEAAREDVEALEREVERLKASSEQSESQRKELESRVQKLAQRSQDVDDLRQQVEQLRAQPAAGTGAQLAQTLPIPSRGEVSFGNYHALVIGIANYSTLPSLPEAEESARQIASTLESEYGFTVNLVLNASRLTIMKALNELRERLTPDDNLLVFYAGHAQRDADGTRAFWQPTDADTSNIVNWISTDIVTEHLDLIPARHVLLVADALFSGLRTRSSVAQLPRGMTDDERYHHIRALREKRSRLVLTSGGLDAGSSSFSNDFVEVLKNNTGVLEASKVYQELVSNLNSTAGTTAPEFASMRWARNEVSDFFFVRKKS